MIRTLAGLLSAILLSAPHIQALERPDKEFKIFQFPPHMIPRIDGQTDDWNMVPETYTIGTGELSDTVKDRGTNHDARGSGCQGASGLGQRPEPALLPLRGL